MLKITLGENPSHNHAVPLPIAPAASEELRNHAELIRSIWADQDHNGDITAARHSAAALATCGLACETLSDVAVKLVLALHELSPCTTRGDGQLAFDPGDLPTANSPALLESAMNDLFGLIERETGPSHWSRAIAAYDAALKVEDEYDREVWSPALTARAGRSSDTGRRVSAHGAPAGRALFRRGRLHEHGRAHAATGPRQDHRRLRRGSGGRKLPARHPGRREALHGEDRSMIEEYSEENLLAVWQAKVELHLNDPNADSRITEPCDESILLDYVPTTMAGVIVQLRHALYCNASRPWIEMAAFGIVDTTWASERFRKQGDDPAAEALWSSILSLEAMGARL